MEEKVIDLECRIIEAAKQVFVRKGYVQTTMGDIAHEVGIGRTALHYYFRTKEMLFSAIFGQLMEAVLPNIKRIVEEEGTILEKVNRVIDQYISVLQDNMLFPVFVISEINRDPAHLYGILLKNPEKIQPLIELKDQLAKEMEKGRLRKINMIDLVSTFMGLLVFPILIRNPLSAIFLEGDMEKFKIHISNRAPFVKEVVARMLMPEE